MKIKIEVVGCFPVLQALDERQFANAIEQRLIDIRNPVTGLQIDLFGKVSHASVDKERAIVSAELDIDEAFFSKYSLSREQVDPLLAARVSKLRHPATGAMHPVQAQIVS